MTRSSFSRKEKAAWSAVLLCAALAPLVLPGCGLIIAPELPVLAAGGGGGTSGGGTIVGGGTAALDDALPISQTALWGGVNDVRALEGDIVVLPEPQLRIDPHWSVFRMLDDTAESEGVNAVPLFEGHSIRMSAAAFLDADGTFRFSDQSTVEVVISPTESATFRSWGSFKLDLQPSPTGFAGPVTEFSASLILPDGDPRTLLVMELVTRPGAHPSTITLEPDPMPPGGWRGEMRVLVDTHFGTPGDPVLALRLPIRTLDPATQIHITTDGLQVDGSSIFPNYKSESDPQADCNGNSIPDGPEISGGQAADCNHNGRPDACDIARGSSRDCDGDGVPDVCQLVARTQGDTNANGLLEPACEQVDCNQDSVEDFAQLSTLDTDRDGYLDGCETDCNGNGLPDLVDLAQGTSSDCNGNRVPDGCELNTDGDALIDVCDGCPADAGKTAAGTCGCGVADADVDGDGELICEDCDDANPTVAVAPGEVRNQRLSRSGAIATLVWDPPVVLGGVSTVYDVLRTENAGDFLAATCLESNDGPNTTAQDSSNPAAGQVYFYLPRAENPCPSGVGSLGTRSNGTPRVGRSCPQCVNGQPCEDGFYCTVSETCQNGICGGGVPRACADGNGCTVDTCGESTDSCLHTNAATGTACDDGLYCTVAETCNAGSCGGGSGRTCASGLECELAACDELSDQCVLSDVPFGEECDDGEFCTSDEACDGNGSCVGGDASCDDGNGCTTDACSEGLDSCSHGLLDDGSACEDGLFCSELELCSDGYCGGGTPETCDDSNLCTEDVCDDSANQCGHSNRPDGVPCGAGQSCVAGECRSDNGQGCATGSDCASGNCNAGFCCDSPTCGPAESCQTGSCRRINGESCAQATECNSLECVDGVCCNTSCGDECKSCNNPGSVGSCAPDPSGTVCAPPSCAGPSSANGPDVCDLGGVCIDGGVQDCGPYVCNGAAGACGTFCASDADCASGFACTIATGVCASLDILATRIAPGGGPMDAVGIAVSTAVRSQVASAVASDGTRFLVVWSDDRAGTGQPDIYGTFVDLAGVVSDPAGFAISTAAGSQTEPAVAFDGTNYLVVWTDTRGGLKDIYGSRVGPLGIVLDVAGIPISVAATDQSSPAVAFGTSTYYVTWADARNGPNLDIYGIRVSPAGAAVNPTFSVSLAVNVQDRPAIAFDGTNFLVVWQDARAVDSDIYGSRVAGVGGNTLDPAGVAVVAQPGPQLEPAVVFNGSVFLVVWEDQRPSAAGPEIYATRVTTTPVPNILDPGGRKITNNAPNRQSAPAVTLEGGNFYVVWVDERIAPGTTDLYASRVDNVNNVLDPAGIPVRVGPKNEADPAASKIGITAFVAWTE